MMTTSETVVTDVSEEILATYNLCLIGPTNDRDAWKFTGFWVGGFAAALAEAQENLTDLLPPGYRVEIREWNEETEETP